ncbi:MAG: phosphoribosylglycinamide formyltransferase [bacterium]|nr:phosphoribosylglycinamide formyltransferase [bacterium]
MTDATSHHNLRPRQEPLRLGFLASGGGSNMQAILDACSTGRLSAEARVVVGNNSRSGALERARNAGIPCYHLSSQTHPDAAGLDGAICDALVTHGVEVVCLAGYMKLLGRRTLSTFRGHILNIHPGLLPRHGGQGFYGRRVHEAVLATGDIESGATVHVVDAVYDNGPVLAQARVPVKPGDTAETLAARVLVQEHRLFPETLQKIATGEIDLERLV